MYNRVTHADVTDPNKNLTLKVRNTPHICKETKKNMGIPQNWGLRLTDPIEHPVN